MITYSIIIPIYNASKWLNKCLVSILNQNNRDFELILIDDGSTDNSGIICDNFAIKDKRIKVYHTPNKGVSAARNIGIHNANGKWLTFIDADDYIEQNYLPSEYDTTADLLIQKWEYINCKMLEQFPTRGEYKNKKCKSYLKENLHKHIFKVPWAKFYRKDLIINNGIRFNENYKLGEDTLFVLQYLKYCSYIIIIAESAYKYNRDSNPNKYIQDIDKTLSYLKTFYNLYSRIKIDNKLYLNSVFSYIRNITEIKDNEINKWENDKTIRLIRNNIERKSITEQLNKTFYQIYYYLKKQLIRG